jgi:branched-chain amino acid transport system substrate-binding protein
MSRKSFRLRHLVVMLVAFALVAAACGDDDAVTTTTAAPATTTTAPAAVPTTEPGAPYTDDIEVVEIQPGESIQIRAHQAISGEVAPLGDDQVRGMQLAIDDFGDVLGFPVNLGTPEDDLCDAAGGQSGAQAIVAQPDVLAVIGTTCSGAARAAAPIITGAGMVLFSGSNTAPDLTSNLLGTAGDNYWPGFFRTAHNDLFQGAAVALFVYEELGLTRAAAVHDGDPYTEGLTAAFRAAFEFLGGEVALYTATTGEAGVSQAALLTDISAANVEVVFFPIFPHTGGPEIIEQHSGIAGLEDVVWFSADGLFVETILSLSDAEGMYFSGPDLDFGANVSATGTDYSAMRDAYIDRFGLAPPAPFHAHTYDATVLVLTAIEAVGEVGDDGVLRVGRQKLRDYLHAVTGFSGLIGPIGCDQFGDCGSQQIQIALHEDSSVTDITETPVVARYNRDDLFHIISG